MAIRDRAFQRVFSKTFVYSILFEDAEVDERFLDVREDSAVLGISGAGCGLAGMMSRRPARIDAVDINPHHLALAAVKMEASRAVGHYSAFYDLLGRGWSPEPDALVRPLTEAMPTWMARYWRKRARTRFARTLYHEGLTARMLVHLRRRVGMDASWVRRVAAMAEADRVSALLEILDPLRRSLPVRAALRSPAQLLALGINFEQRDRIVQTEKEDMVDFFVHHLTRVMHTDLATNWVAWFAAAGQFNHEREDAVPPYLRRDRWERAQGAPTQTRYLHRNLFDVLGEAPANTWSHYTLCDAVDWMPEPVQRRLFDEILRTSRPGAIVLWRSVEEEQERGNLVDRLGYGRRFHRLPGTEGAAALDRTRMYRQVNYFQVSA